MIRLTEQHHLATLIIRHLSKGVGGKAIIGDKALST
jgi:hypothetical protein